MEFTNQVLTYHVFSSKERADLQSVLQVYTFHGDNHSNETKCVDKPRPKVQMIFSRHKKMPQNDVFSNHQQWGRDLSHVIMLVCWTQVDFSLGNSERFKTFFKYKDNFQNILLVQFGNLMGSFSMQQKLFSLFYSYLFNAFLLDEQASHFQKNPFTPKMNKKVIYT